MPKLALAACVPATDWNSRSTGAPRSSAASCVVMCARQQACVGTSSASMRRSSAAEDRGDDLDRFRRRVHADHGVAAAEEQAVDGRQQDAAEVVARVVRLHADAEHAALAQRVAAACHDADLARGQHQILVAHQLRRRPPRPPA